MKYTEKVNEFNRRWGYTQWDLGEDGYFDTNSENYESAIDQIMDGDNQISIYGDWLNYKPCECCEKPKTGDYPATICMNWERDSWELIDISHS